ncbi:adenosine deaminase [Yinghuangia soli]|uniref:Adenosine deaminase n=1 Tax=Yinghuangia soli TaxID=2908204 RepID=A0AA41Q0E3_9ACTN|nr:adenosine deaminase [Yinghuangia soli]MCF2527757.1 adenosine deaminase [Yinghuangia soli]
MTTAPDPAAAAAPGSATDAFLAGLPKAELHVHLEGSLLPATLLTLARKHGLDTIPPTVEAIESWYEFQDFGHFIKVYVASVEALRDEADFALLAAETGRSLAAQNVRYAEVHVSLQSHLVRGIPAEVVFAGIEAGRRDAERDTGIRLRWIPDFAGQFGPEAGELTLDAVLKHGPSSVIGFGVGGIEVERDQFEAVFARARAEGLKSLPHAGEVEGADRVWSAVRALKADRIGHGIRSMDDPELVAHLRDTQLPLDVSPTSNLRTSAVARPEDHPLPRMIEEGLMVTLNSDDPPMFGTTLQGEYRFVRDLGLGTPAILELARNGVRASFLDADGKRELLAEIDTYAATADGA